MNPRIVNDLVPTATRMSAHTINPLISTFSPDDSLATCAGLIGELGELISIANDKDPQCRLGGLFHVFACIQAAIEFELRAGKPA